jgi:hypothetical protein
MIPPIIYNIELVERYLIQLSKRTEYSRLISFIKRSLARDFKINVNEIDLEALANQSDSENEDESEEEEEDDDPQKMMRNAEVIDHSQHKKRKV